MTIIRVVNSTMRPVTRAATFQFFAECDALEAAAKSCTATRLRTCEGGKNVPRYPQLFYYLYFRVLKGGSIVTIRADLTRAWNRCPNLR